MKQTCQNVEDFSGIFWFNTLCFWTQAFLRMSWPLHTFFLFPGFCYPRTWTIDTWLFFLMIVTTVISVTPPGPWMPRGAPSSAAQCFPMAGSWPRPQGWRCASSWERRSRWPSTATGCCVPPTQYPSSSSPLPASSPAGRCSVWGFCLCFFI